MNMKNFCILLVLLSINFIGFGQSITINGLDMATTPQKVINKGIGGYHGAIDNSCKTFMPSGVGTCNNPQFDQTKIDILTKTNVQTMRFPYYGIPFYHFGLNKSGMGYDSTELYWNRDDADDIFLSCTIVTKPKTKKITEILNRENRQYTKNAIFDFIRYVKSQQSANNSTVNAIYAANIFQHLCVSGGTINTCPIGYGITNPVFRNVQPGTAQFNTMLNETLDAIKLLKDSSINIVGVEFDNEPFYWAYGFKSNKVRVQQYIQICKAYTDSIKKYYPTIKVATPLEHKNYQDTVYGKNFYHYYMTNENYYDAFSFHSYEGSMLEAPTNSCNYTTGNRYTLCASGDYQCDKNGVNFVVNNTYCNTSSNYPITLNGTNNYFDYKNKEYWYLEYNLNAKNTPNSLLHADWFYKNLFSHFIPSDRIKYAIYWGSVGTPNSVADTSNPAASHWGSLMRFEGNSPRYNDAYYPATYVSKIFTNNLKLLNVDWNNWQTLSYVQTNTFTGIDNNNLFLRCFVDSIKNIGTHGSKEVYLYVYFSNTSNKKISINYSSMAFAPYQTGYTNFTVNTSKQLEINYEQRPYSSFSTVSWNNNQFFSTGIFLNNTDTMRENSIGYIKIPLISGCTYCRLKSDTSIQKNFEKNFENQYDFIFYPNPSNGIVNFEFKNSEFFKSLEIYDIAGKIILQKEIYKNEESLDLSNLSKGVYLYKIIKQNGNPIVEKFILQ